MQITLRQMQVFLAVARTENLSVAAQDLAMSKSAVSQALTELEGRLGVTLFERTRGRLLLSAEGRRLKPAADELMERTDDIESLFSGRTTGQLRLACTFTIGSFMLSDLMRDFQAHAGWMPEMRIANTAEVAESLLNFSTDISIVEGPVTNPHLITEPWISDEMVVVAPKGHRLTQGVATWEQLSREHWILREEGSSTRIFFDAQIGLHLSEHNIVANVNSFETIVGMMLKEAKQSGKTFRLFCPETRPYFQGARLTATVCHDMGFDVTVITDNMPAFVMEREHVDLFTCAADAICLDGYVVNKVGTLQIAICANHFGIPTFVTGAPDIGHETKDTVKIEMRDPEFTLQAMGVRTAAQGVKGYYPAFDMTPPHLISGIVTDRGVFSPFDLHRYFAGGGAGEYDTVV